MSYYIHLGSSTVKIYEYQDKKVELISEKSILFKSFYDQESGISLKNYRMLLTYLKDCIKQFGLNRDNTKIYATGIWRKIPQSQIELIQADIYDAGLKFHVISHEQENHYFQKAMQGIYDRKRVLMVNMGGKTTEIVVYDKGNMIDKKNLTIGVADILEEFPNINDIDSNPSSEEIVNYGLKLLENIEIPYEFDCAIHTGGELRFQKLAGYPLVKNTVFEDGIHEFMISFVEFSKRNQELLKIPQQELYNLMPSNPTWMEGAKAGAYLGEIIFKKAKIDWIVPSDLNIVHGIVKEEERLNKN